MLKKLTKLQLIGFSVFGLLILLANSSLHPISGTGGYTAAPGDSLCSACHTGNNTALNGEIEISGLPSTIMQGTTYPLTITVTNPNGNAVRAGFQIVALNANNTNSGTFSNNSPNSQLRNAGGKTYLGHSPSVSFGAGTQISWTVNWTAPTSGSGNITIYGATVIANGNGANTGDRVRFSNITGTLASQPDPLMVNITNVQGTSCHDSNNGSATANVTGGTSPYNYSWSNGSNQASPNNLPPGNASVTVTDSAGQSAIANTFIPAPSPLLIQINQIENTRCHDTGDGYALIEATGGIPPYQLNWSNGFTGNEGFPLPAGFYTITVSDGNGCTSSIGFQINSPPPIVLTQSTITNPSCNSLSNGSISVQAGGGNPGYSYLWSTGATSTSIQNLNAGNYSLTVTDSNGCTQNFNFQLTQPPLVNIVTVIIQNPTCSNSNNGILLAIPSGGSGSGYSFLWSNGMTNDQIGGLTTGTYSVTVTDGTGCSNTAEVVLTEGGGLTIDHHEIVNTSCPDAEDGSITIEVVGGSGGYTIEWSNGNTTFLNNNISAGIYTVTISDESGCELVRGYTVATRPYPEYNIESSNVNCFGNNDGSIAISLQIGYEDYNVIWSDGFSGDQRQNLQSGIYHFFVSKSDICTISDSVEISEPQEFTVIPQINDLICFNDSSGSIEISVSGGSGGYSYEWSNGTEGDILSDVTAGSYTVTVSDSLGCSSFFEFTIMQPDALEISELLLRDVDCFGAATGSVSLVVIGGTGNKEILWNDGDDSFNRDNLSAGEYSLTIKDANNCMLTEIVEIFQADEIIATFTIENESESGANDGKISILTLTGGVGNLSLLWSNGSTEEVLENLAPGIYRLTITDENSCEKTYQLNVSGGACSITAEIDIIQPLCWDSNDGRMIINFDNEPSEYTIMLSPVADIDSLAPGVYSLTIQYGENCFIEFADLQIIAPEPIKVDIIGEINASGPETEDGGFDIEIEGGTGNYTYQWLNENGNIISTDSNPKNLKPGSYTLRITDDNNCTTTIENLVVDFINATNNPGQISLSIQPNPFTNVVNILSDAAIKKVIISDLHGKRAIRENFSDKILTLNLEMLAPGVYSIYILTDKGIITKKILKQ